MSPLEPRPVVMGTMGLPSTEDAEALGFLPKRPVALNFAGASRLLLAAPSADRNDRRFQPNFRFMRSPFNFLRELSIAYCRSAGGVGGLTTIALPTISIKESPGIHSTARQARDGLLPWEK